MVGVGILSLVSGLYFLLASPMFGVGFLFGVVGVIFGIVDLLVAFLYWRTGRLSWFILLVGPIVFIPAIQVPAGIPEAWVFTLFLLIFPLVFFFIILGFFWTVSWFPKKVLTQVAPAECKRCGASLVPGYRYCPFCGEPVKGEQ